MKKKFLNIILTVALGTMLLTGCGSKNSSEYTDQAMASLTVQNYGEALTYFDQAMLGGEDQELIYRGMGLCYMGQGEYRKAISAFESSLANAGMFPGELEYDINYYMAICYYKLGLYNEAISVYDAIATLNPKDYEVYMLRGTMKLYLADVEHAMEDFDTAVSIKKNDYGIYIDVYQCMLDHGYASQGQKYLDVVMTADSKDIEEYDKGRLCFFQQNYTQATTYLERAREEGNTSCELITLLGECYKRDAKYEFAAVVYSSYLEKCADPLIYNQMGLCYVEQGDYNLALGAFQAGAGIQENNTCMQTLKLNEIACYEYLHDYDTAAAKLSEYLAIYPGNQDLEREYAFLTTR